MGLFMICKRLSYIVYLCSKEFKYMSIIRSYFIRTIYSIQKDYITAIINNY